MTLGLSSRYFGRDVGYFQVFRSHVVWENFIGVFVLFQVSAGTYINFDIDGAFFLICHHEQDSFGESNFGTL